MNYEKLMVEAVGGLPSAKPVLDNAERSANVAEAVENGHVVVQNEISFRQSFFDALFSRGAAVRTVG